MFELPAPLLANQVTSVCGEQDIESQVKGERFAPRLAGSARRREGIRDGGQYIRPVPVELQDGRFELACLGRCRLFSNAPVENTAQGLDGMASATADQEATSCYNLLQLGPSTTLSTVCCFRQQHPWLRDA
jgi:hypothetical protein